MSSSVPAWLDDTLPTVEEIHRRLQLIFPEEIDPRGFVRREMAAKTLFVMLYGYAVEGRDRWIRPTAVTDMNDTQAGRQAKDERTSWLDRVQSPLRPRRVAGRWYEENTREPIRDETLREFLQLGAVIERPGLPTTSPRPRYALASDFTELFSPRLAGTPLTAAIEAWQEANITPAARARVALARKGVGASDEGVLVTLPNGETRRLTAGPSSILTRAVVEQFAPRFLQRPAVILLSESAQKATFRDEELCRAIGLDLNVSETLPDLILADLGTEPLLLLFAECVVTDGPVNERRRRELENLARQAGFDPRHCAHVTIFPDRAKSRFRRMAASLAWGSFAWFATEPDHLICFYEGEPKPITTLVCQSGA